MHVISPKRSPGFSSAMGLSYGKSTAASIGMKGRLGFFAALMISSRGVRHAFQPAEKSSMLPCGLDVRDRAREIHLGFAFENVESRGSEIAFAADDLARAKCRLTTAF